MHVIYILITFNSYQLQVILALLEAFILYWKLLSFFNQNFIKINYLALQDKAITEIQTNKTNSTIITATIMVKTDKNLILILLNIFLFEFNAFKNYY